MSHEEKMRLARRVFRINGLREAARDPDYRGQSFIAIIQRNARESFIESAATLRHATKKEQRAERNSMLSRRDGKHAV